MPLAIDENRYNNPIERIGVARDILGLLTPGQAHDYVIRFAELRLARLNPDALQSHPKHPTNGGNEFEWGSLVKRFEEERGDIEKALGQIRSRDTFERARALYQPKTIDKQIQEAQALVSEAVEVDSRVHAVQQMILNDRTERTPGTIYDGVPRSVVLFDYGTAINAGVFESDLHAKELPTSFADLATKDWRMRTAIRVVSIDERGRIAPRHGETESSHVVPLIEPDLSKPRFSTLAFILKLSGGKMPATNRLLPGEGVDPSTVRVPPFHTDFLPEHVVAEMVPFMTTKWTGSAPARHQYLLSLRNHPEWGPGFRVEGLVLEVRELPKPPVEELTLPELPIAVAEEPPAQAESPEAAPEEPAKSKSPRGKATPKRKTVGRGKKKGKG